MIRVKNHHITAIVRVEIDLQRILVFFDCFGYFLNVLPPWRFNQKVLKLVPFQWFVLNVVQINWVYRETILKRKMKKWWEYFGRMSQPCPRKDPMPNQRAFDIVHTWFWEIMLTLGTKWIVKMRIMLIRMYYIKCVDPSRSHRTETEQNENDGTNICGRALSVIVPLVRRNPCQTKQGDCQGQVGRCCVDPHLGYGDDHHDWQSWCWFNDDYDDDDDCDDGDDDDDNLDGKWLEEGEWIWGRRRFLLVQDPHLGNDALTFLFLYVHYFSVLTPVLMNGIVKSTAVCRIEVTDMSITAMSAFWDLSSAIIPVHLVVS